MLRHLHIQLTFEHAPYMCTNAIHMTYYVFILVAACDASAYSGNIGQLISNSTLSGAATYDPTVEECWH